MRSIQISDITLGECGRTGFTFREKIEAAKLLDRMGVSVVELGALSGQTADKLLIKSVAPSLSRSTLAVCTGFGAEEIEAVWSALREAAHPRLQICAAVSTARMEYVYHKKAAAMIPAVSEAIILCAKLCPDVEFIAEDATRADFGFLCSVLEAAIDAGAGTVTVCDTAGVMLPDEFGAFVRGLYEKLPRLSEITLGVRCSNALNTAEACAAAAIKEGAGEIKAASLPADAPSLSGMAKLFSVKGEALGIASSLQTTEIKRLLESIERLGGKPRQNSPFEDGVRSYPEDMSFTSSDSIDEIVKGAAFLGYELNENDKMRIWKAFKKISQRKDRVSIGELEAIIASEAMQVPATYTLENYLVTTGNTVDILAHVKLRKGEELFDGFSIGDGPIDASFLAIEKITGHHYELDDFQIQSITEGREAMGQTVVKLRSGGKVYSGRGISTDIIGSGVAAYVNALNKILYEEGNR